MAWHSLTGPLYVANSDAATGWIEQGLGQVSMAAGRASQPPPCAAAGKRMCQLVGGWKSTTAHMHAEKAWDM